MIEKGVHASCGQLWSLFFYLVTNPHPDASQPPISILAASTGILPKDSLVKSWRHGPGTRCGNSHNCGSCRGHDTLARHGPDSAGKVPINAIYSCINHGHVSVSPVVRDKKRAKFLDGPWSICRGGLANVIYFCGNRQPAVN